MNEKARIKLREELRAFLDADKASASPVERGARQRDLCSPLEYLLQSLMDGQTGWDSRYSWIDGILPDSITRTSHDALTVNGLAVVVHGDEPHLRPVQADLARPPTVSSIRFASPGTEFVYSHTPRRYLAPTSWPSGVPFKSGRPVEAAKARSPAARSAALGDLREAPSQPPSTCHVAPGSAE
jgi:hypothetical protein